MSSTVNKTKSTRTRKTSRSTSKRQTKRVQPESVSAEALDDRNAADAGADAKPDSSVNAPANSSANQSLPESVKFFINPISDDAVSGWFCNVLRTELRYEIQAWCNGVMIGYGQAKEESSQARQAGMPVSDIGFRFKLPAFIKNGKTHHLEFRVAHKSSGDPGLALPKTLTYRSSDVAKLPPERRMLIDPAEDAKWVSELSAGAAQAPLRYVFNRVAPKLGLHLQCMELTQAKALLEFGLKGSNQHAYFGFKAAELMLLKSQWEKAAELFTAALQQMPGQPDICIGLAHALERQGEAEKAKDLLRLVLKANAKHKRARIFFMKLEARRLLGRSDAKTKWNALFLVMEALWLECVDDDDFEDLMLQVLAQKLKAEDQALPSDCSTPEFLDLRRERLLLETALAVFDKTAKGPA